MIADELMGMKAEADMARRRRPDFNQKVEILYRHMVKAARAAARDGESRVSVHHYPGENDEQVAIEAGRRLEAQGLDVWFNCWSYSVSWGAPVCGVGSDDSSPLKQAPEPAKPKFEIIDGGSDDSVQAGGGTATDGNGKVKNKRFRWLGL